MSNVSIGISENGRNSTLLTACVGNDLQVKWQLTDSQLLHLVSMGVSILRSRALHNAYVAGEFDRDIRKILGEQL
jgi:hypothetical protein